MVFLVDASQVEIGRKVGFYCGEAAVAELLCASLVVEYVAGICRWWNLAGGICRCRAL